MKNLGKALLAIIGVALIAMLCALIWVLVLDLYWSSFWPWFSVFFFVLALIAHFG